MYRFVVLFSALSLVLAGCADAERPAVADAITATPAGWSEPIDDGFIADPSIPFLAGELISYGYENSDELVSRPAEFGGLDGYKVARPQVLYSDGTQAGTRFLLEAVLEVGRNGPNRPLAVSDGTNGYFIATTWAPATELCLSVDGSTCPDDATALYWSDGAQSVKLADLPRAGGVGSVRDIALVRDGERSATCLVRGSGGEPASERLIVSCYEKGAVAPRELMSEIPSGAKTELAGVGSRLFILSGVAETLFSWDPFTEGATEVALDAAAGERPLDLITSRSDDGSALTTLFVSETPSESGTDQLTRIVALGELAPITLFEERAPLGESSTLYNFDSVRLDDTLYLRIGTSRDGELRNRLISYDATSLAQVSSGLDIYGGPFELLPVGETLWAVGERAVYEVARNGVVERDSRDETFDSPLLVPTGVLGEAYLYYRDLTSESQASLWFYLAPGAPAVPVVGLSELGSFDPVVNDGRLYLVEPETTEPGVLANVIAVEKTTVSRLDLAPEGEGWTSVRLRAIAGRLVVAYARIGEARDPDYVGGALVRLMEVAPR